MILNLKVLMLCQGIVMQMVSSFRLRYLRYQKLDTYAQVESEKPQLYRDSSAKVNLNEPIWKESKFGLWKLTNVHISYASMDDILNSMLFLNVFYSTSASLFNRMPGRRCRRSSCCHMEKL